MLQDFRDLSRPKVTVVIPTLNEARNLPHVLTRLPEWLHEVIIVDGHSVDSTVAIARQLRPDARILTQNRYGKGNALACGFAAATGDIIATIDADGSADPSEIPRFVDVLLNGADFAKGTRFGKGVSSAGITRLHRSGNRLLNGLANLLCHTHYSDLCYGFNAFWRQHLPALGLDAEAEAPASMKLWGNGFEVETLINIRIASAGLIVKEVVSNEYRQIYKANNLNALREGVRVLGVIIYERFRARTRRSPVKHRPVLPSKTPEIGERVVADLDEAEITFDTNKLL
jgi:glycosyltransferase involved in cell wall biosynthesis